MLNKQALYAEAFRLLDEVNVLLEKSRQRMEQRKRRETF